MRNVHSAAVSNKNDQAELLEHLFLYFNRGESGMFKGKFSFKGLINFFDFLIFFSSTTNDA